MGLETSSSAKSFFTFTGVLSTVIAASSIIAISTINPAALLGTGISLGAVTGLSVAGAVLSFAGAAVADIFQKRANQDELVSKLNKSANTPQMTMMHGYGPQQYQPQQNFEQKHQQNKGNSWSEKVDQQAQQATNIAMQR